MEIVYIVCLIIIITGILVSVLILRNKKSDKENWWRGRGWGGWRRGYGWAPGYLSRYIEDPTSRQYTNCVLNNPQDPNRDENCCLRVFGTSCVNV